MKLNHREKEIIFKVFDYYTDNDYIGLGNFKEETTNEELMQIFKKLRLELTDY